MPFTKSRASGLWRSSTLRSSLVDRLGGNAEDRTASQAEMQHDVQRFAGRFTDHVTQAAERLADPSDPGRTEAALRCVVLYAGNALEIATGPVPGLNLLDMLVFVSLVRGAFVAHWQPELFAAHGNAMADALTAAEVDAWSVAEKYLLPAQRVVVREAIEHWQAAHPDQHRVESVRLSDFSELAAESNRKDGVHGLLQDVRDAARMADQGLLLGDRALFWAQRAPTLIRVQTRLGALEITADALRRLNTSHVSIERGGKLLHDVQALAPMLLQATELTHELARISAQGGALLHSAQTLSTPLLANRAQAEGPPLTVLEVLAHDCARLGASLQASVEHVPPPGMVGTLLARGESLARRTLGYAALAFTACIAVFWLGYYLAHR